MAKKKKQKLPAVRTGADAWLAVRLKTGAGPMAPKPLRGTRAEHERESLRDHAE